MEHFEGRSLGSPLRLTIHTAGDARPDGPDPGEAVRAWRAVEAAFVLADAAMSRFRADSEITVLNRIAGTGRWSAVSRPLAQALATADRARRVTGGLFDAGVLHHLERLGYRGADVGPSGGSPDGPSGASPDGSPDGSPDDATAASPAGSPAPADRDRAARRAVAVAVSHPVELRRDGIRLAGPMDLGGIGKGLTLRWGAAAIAGASPAASFLLEAGGDLVVRGSAPEGDPWRVGIEDPGEAARPLAVVCAVDLAVATSSVRINRWRVDGRDVHHLVDPRSGDPADGGLLAVTVAASDPAWAEVWSKALFVAGRREIGGLARSRGMAAWWVLEDGSLEMTPAARQLTAWTVFGG